MKSLVKKLDCRQCSVRSLLLFGPLFALGIAWAVHWLDLLPKPTIVWHDVHVKSDAILDVQKLVQSDEFFRLSLRRPEVRDFAIFSSSESRLRWLQRNALIEDRPFGVAIGFNSTKRGSAARAAKAMAVTLSEQVGLAYRKRHETRMGQIADTLAERRQLLHEWKCRLAELQASSPDVEPNDGFVYIPEVKVLPWDIENLREQIHSLKSQHYQHEKALKSQPAWVK